MSLQQRKVVYEAEHFPHYYLCTYIPKTRGGDLLSQSVVHFKSGNSPHQQAWIECAVEEVKKVSELRNAYVIRALGHQERSYTKNEPMNALMTKICNAVNGTHVATFLEKVRDVKKLALLTRADREQELYKAYRFTAPDRNPKHILIIDDILTSGSTIRAIIGSILNVLPSVNISIFTLAYTDQQVNLNEGVTLKGKSYSWQPNEGWMLAAEDSPEYGATLTRLKHCILSDSFQ